MKDSDTRLDIEMSRDSIYETIIRPILFRSDPEEAHNFVHSMLSLGLPGMSWKYDRNDLELQLFGTKLANPIGLAAGFDKNGSLVSVLPKLGFGYAEIGSVCARPHGGNPRPRLFRLPEDEALINRLGLNGLGAHVVAQRLAHTSIPLPIGLNIAKTNDPSITGDAAVEDIVSTFTEIKGLPLAYVTINASCPNTKEGCVNESETLRNVFSSIQEQNERRLPILVKLSPDSSGDFIEEVVAIAIAYKLAGFVCGNTSISRDGLQTPEKQLRDIGAGGLSGAPLKALNLNLCRKVFSAKQAEQIIVGVGGIASGMDAYQYISAGATTVQLYSSMVYRGPSVVRQICQELAGLLQKNSTKLADLVGSTAS